MITRKIPRSNVINSRLDTVPIGLPVTKKKTLIILHILFNFINYQLNHWTYLVGVHRIGSVSAETGINKLLWSIVFSEKPSRVTIMCGLWIYVCIRGSTGVQND